MSDLFINFGYSPTKYPKLLLCEDEKTRLTFLFHPEDFGICVNEKYNVDFEFSGMNAIDEVFARNCAWGRLNTIKELLQQGFYKEALTLSLLLPDICSKVVATTDNTYSNDIGERYRKWIDDNIYQFDIGCHGAQKNKFDCVNGYFCYNLRCKLVHGDAEDVQLLPNKPESSFMKQGYKQVFFRFTDADESILISICNEKKEKYAIIGHSVKKLVLTILCAANTLYQNTADKSLFYDGCEIVHITAKLIDINNGELN